MGRSLGIGIVGLEAVTNGYLLTLSALMLLGGALGDRFRRSRVFAIGLCGFAFACAGCAIAPTAPVLVACRVLQGVFSALLVPNSLAMLETAFTGEARGVAIGQWSAWSAVSTAIGPLLGGWVVDRASWRWVFASMVPFALAAAWIALRHGEAADSPQQESPSAGGSIDYTGAALITVALAGLIWITHARDDPGANECARRIAGGGRHHRVRIVRGGRTASTLSAGAACDLPIACVHRRQSRHAARLRRT